MKGFNFLIFFIHFQNTFCFFYKIKYETKYINLFYF